MKRLSPYKPSWRAAFRAEAGQVGDALGPALLAAHHIGSTAVPGMLAKPVIDILLAVTSLEAVDERAAEMAALGYDVRGDYGVLGRRYFARSSAGDGPGVHVHAFAAGNAQIARHIAFRDRLRTSQGAAEAYADLKRRLSHPDGTLTAEYQAAKKSWVDAMSEDALRYAPGTVRAVFRS